MGRAFQSQHLGELGLGRLRCRICGEVLARRHHVLGRDEDQRAAESLRDEETQGLASDDEVACGIDRERALPVGELEADHRRRVRDARVRHEEIQSAVGEHRLLERRPHRRLARHVHLEAERPAAPDGRHDPIGGRSCARGVDIAHDDVGTLGGEAPRDGSPDAGTAASDQRDPAGQLLLRRHQRELVELERPVLDAEGVRRGKRDVVAEGSRVAKHVDRVVVDVTDDAGSAPVFPRREHPEPRDQHDARERVEQLRALEPVLLEVARVVDDEALDGPLDRLQEGRARLGAVGGHEAWEPLGVDCVVRRGRPDLRDARRVRRGDEFRHVVRVVEGHDDPVPAAQQAAQARRHRQRRLAPRRRREHGHAGAPEDGTAPLSLGDGRLGAGDQLDRGLVRFPDGRSPGDRAMTLEEEGFRLGAVGDRVGHVPGDAEPGSAIRERDDVLSVDALDHVMGAVVVRQRHDGVRVGVDDRGGREEAVQQGLDRGAHAAGLLQRVGEVAHHLLVAHLVAVQERCNVVHAHAGKVSTLDGLEVGAAPLDPEYGDLPAAMVALACLDRSVAAAPDHQRGLGADQARRVDEEVKAVELAFLRDRDWRSGEIARTVLALTSKEEPEYREAMTTRLKDLIERRVEL